MSPQRTRLLWLLPAAACACAVMARSATGQEAGGDGASPDAAADGSTRAAPTRDGSARAAPSRDGGARAAPTRDTALAGGDEPHVPKDGRGRGLTVLPAVYYNPENGLSASAAVLGYFRADARSRRSSEIQLEGTATVRGEVGVYLKPTLWLSGDDYMLRASAGVAQREQSFFGVGNDTVAAAEELYEERRLSLYFEATRRITGEWRAGVSGYVQRFTMLEVADGGLLDSDAVRGSDGGVLSGLGALFEYDTRDHVYGPRSGVFARAAVRVYDDLVGSEFDYVIAVLDGRYYVSLPRRGVLAVQGRVELRAGDLPFQDMSLAGGKSMLRGMLQGRYRDAHFVGAQVEYRVPVWWRLGAVAFAGGGRVAGRVDELDLTGWKHSLGAGLRFAVVPEDRINVRVDVGTSDGDVNVYLDILEAF